MIASVSNSSLKTSPGSPSRSLSRSVSMPLQQLLAIQAEHECTGTATDIIVTGISADSRMVSVGDLFIARDGSSYRGIDFIEQAAKAGAVAALVERKTTSPDELESFSIPVFQVDDVVTKIGIYAALMWDNPSKKMTLIGVTGTNGKTSCAHYLAQALTALGKKTALIGTVGNGFPGALSTATHTTPDAISLQQMLAGFYHQDADVVVMEVSSHALDQGRVIGVDFSVVALTNLSRDHLDYHGSMSAYAAAKSQLFLPPEGVLVDSIAKAQGIVLNADDELGRTLATRLYTAGQSFCRYSTELDCSEVTASVSRVNSRCETEADNSAATDSQQRVVKVVLQRALLSPQGMSLAIRLPTADIGFNAPLVGDFNVSNLLLVVSVLQQLKISPAQIEAVMAQVTAVPGRMQCLSRAGYPTVIVDYAHTPDALEKALLAARKHCQGRLWVVFGCGGDRDTGKRAEMAAIAQQGADHIIVTSDNPRTEAPEAIIEMIMQGFMATDQVLVLADREAAICTAMQMAAPDDLVVVAGKGHEDYQDIMNIKHPFSDQQVVYRCMKVQP